MSLVLYHYTSSHSIAKVRAQGLTKGVLPWNLDKDGNPTFRKGFQWLTTNPNFGQAWCLLGNLPFSRNAYRITVLVPANAEQHVLSWPELCRRCKPDCAEELNRTGGDVDNWRLFHGSIPPKWFLEVARNNGELLSATPLILG
jgi:hypothetical protein